MEFFHIRFTKLYDFLLFKKLARPYFTNYIILNTSKNAFVVNYFYHTFNDIIEI